MEQARIIPVDNETKNTATRTTKNGRSLTYRLRVLQQPARARACGAGAKSSADRRPVDPPPIVELKVFDSDNTDTDVTFSLNANYFLFATLEQARPMATNNRIVESKQQLCVLTGTPVAGMVYLDRPEPAGYFIFPDLSVRHEGKYRLSFSLYEEIKETRDSDGVDDRPVTPSDTHVTHRLEVKSEPFTVFSAKKFPGLTESTMLSRTVAEQGCRVRIRRDVRMRRRDTKSGGKDWENYEDETADQRGRMSATPEPPYPVLPTPQAYMDSNGRPRSSSNASHQSLANPLSRRTSLQELSQSYSQPFGTGPHTPQNGYVQSSPFGPSPRQQYSQPPFMQQPPMQPPPPQYPQQAYQPPPMSAPAVPQQSYYPYAPPPAPAQYGAPPAFESNNGRMSMDFAVPAEHRRSSTQYSVPPPPPPASFSQHPPAHSYQVHAPVQPSYPTQQSNYQSQQGSYNSQDNYGSRIPPPQPVQPPTRSAGAHTPLSSRPSFDTLKTTPSLPPLQMPNSITNKLEPSPLQRMPASSSYYPITSAAPINGAKRPYNNSFREPSGPLRHGARPGDARSNGYIMHGHPAPPPHGLESDDDARETARGFYAEESDRKSMVYPRANGSWERRPLPPHSDE